MSLKKDRNFNTHAHRLRIHKHTEILHFSHTTVAFVGPNSYATRLV